MPYITDARRMEMEEGACEMRTAGELNFGLTTLVDDFLDRQPDGLSYAAINEAIGALECAKLELYRRIAAPYEDEACARNGDVYISNRDKKQ